MRLISKKSQIRRDFTGIYECEHCKETHEAYGYDDTYFHSNVIPKMVCKKCGKQSPEGCEVTKPIYPDSTII